MPTPDAFDILGLPARFDLDAAAIQRAYLARTGSLHPDIAEPGGEDEGAAARLNAARQTLEDPERRATELLARLGGPGKDQDRSLPEGFLAEMLEAREQMEAQRGDAAAMRRWEAWGEGKRRAHIEAAGRLFGAAGAHDPARLALIRRELNAWRYIERLLEQVHGEEGSGLGR